MGFILFFVSNILKVCFTPILWIYGIFASIHKREYDKWNKSLALSNDQYGNCLGKYLFNDLFITQNSQHKFGNLNETISSVLGKNKRANTLTIFGQGLEKILDIFEPNHAENSIKLPNNDD